MLSLLKSKKKAKMDIHGSLKKANMVALYFIAFWFLPVGQITLIVAASAIEIIGIALFFSDLFVTKLSTYLSKVGWASGMQWGAIASILAGVLLASLNGVGTFVFRLIGSLRWAAVFSFAFWAVSSFTYYAMLSISRDVSLTLIIGIALMNGIPSVIISVCSNNLAVELGKMAFFKDLVSGMYKTTRMTVNKDGKLVMETV